MESPPSALRSTIEKWLVTIECEPEIHLFTRVTPKLASCTHPAKRRRIGNSNTAPYYHHSDTVPTWSLDMPTTPPPTTSRASPSSASESFAKRRRVEPAPETEHASEWESAAGTHLDLLVAGVLDPEKTPTASKTEALQPQYKRLSLQSQRPILRPTGVGRLHSPGKRGASPVKGMDDLERLRKPVQFAPLPIGRRRKEVLPREVHKLANNISNRTISGFVPSQVKEEFAQATDCDLEDLPAAWFRENDEVVDKAEGLSELRGVRAIHRAAIESAEFRRSEPAWNAKVHQPVLDLALDDGLWRKEEEEFQPGRDAERHRVGAEYIATATLTGDCIPRLRAQFKPFQDDETASNAGSVLACSAISSSDSAASGSYEEDVFEGERARAVHDATIHSRAGSKKVDFALIVIPGRGTRLAQAINKMIDRLDAKGLENLSAGLPQPSLSINPTQYAPVKRRPMACIIETKIVPNAHDPQVLLQVGFMIAALHQRMDGFLISSHPPAYITIPVISVVCHDWTLHFACDRGTHIELMGPLFLGSTKSMEDIYKLIACLRSIQAWIHEEYCPWLLHWLSESTGDGKLYKG